MKALYRKYRPKNLAEVVGQEQVTQILASSLASGKINHAYLFIGPRGTGKTSVARIFAHEVNGFQYELEDDYVDIVEIDGASNRGIDNIRELKEKAMVAPTSGKYKIYIIDEVHMLTKEAFNALLKTLEEPPAHVIFIMATTDAYKVPVTITSRAQTYTFKLASKSVMTDFLKSVAKREDIKIDDDALEIIVKRGGGSFRDSLSLLDQIATLSDSQITKAMVVGAMGLPEDEKIRHLLEEYSIANLAGVTKAMRDLLSTGVKPETLAEEIIGMIVEEPKTDLIPLLAKLPDVKEPFAEARLLVCLTERPLAQFSPSDTTAGQRNVAKSVTKLNTDANKDKSVDSNTNVDAVTSKDTTTNANTAGGSTTNHQSIVDGTMNWESYLDKIKGLNEVIYTQLRKSEHELSGNTLHIYPKTKIIRNILTSKNNKQILINNASGYSVEVHEAGEHPDSTAKDELLSKFSAIMGGEVTNEDGGNSPF